MHELAELPAWERLLKKIVWAQLGDVQGKNILDFGSGEGITANHFAENNYVVAIEPSQDMLVTRWADFEYRQIQGDVKALSVFDDNTFDMIICHNVLEYIEDKKSVLAELYRVLKPQGILSIVKHNRAGRVMQMAVLLESKISSEVDKKGGIDSYEIGEETIDEDEAKVKATIKYGDGSEKESTIKLKKNEDGDWKIDAGK